MTDAYVCRLLPLTCLAPDIVEAILDGRQPKGLRLAEMLGNGPVGWEEQRRTWSPLGPLRDAAQSARPSCERRSPVDQDAASARGALSTSSASAPGATAGSAIVKVEPAPGVLSTVTSPPSIWQ